MRGSHNLTEAEANACRGIALLLIGCPPAMIEHWIRAARNKAIADALIAGWDLGPSGERGFAFSERIARELVAAIPDRVQ